MSHGGEGMGRYRWRTALRERLPWWLINLGMASKGKRDCGDHEWYRQAGEVWACYHCESGRRVR